MRSVVGLLAGALLAVGLGPAQARPASAGHTRTAHARHADAAALSQSDACRRLRAEEGHLRLARPRRHLTVLVTGDSMIQPLDKELKREPPPGVSVIVDRHDGTGLIAGELDWRALARRQELRFRPDVTVISVGGRDGGYPLKDHRQTVECCSARWLQLYAGLAGALVHSYARHGHGRVLWLALPVPREAARAPLFAAVTEAVRLLASSVGSSLAVIPVDGAVSPGGFRATVRYGGLTLHPRVADGIHLSVEGACIERNLVFDALVGDGLLYRAAGAAR